MKPLKAMLLGAALVGAVALTAQAPAQAKDFPAKDVTLTVPLSPGGGSDLTMRALARAAEKELGVSIVVVNRPGAGGAVGLSEAMNMKPDGYNLVMLSEYVYNLPATQAVAFTPADFAPICTVNFDPAAIAVGKDSKLNTFGTFVDYAKANPRVVTVGNSGFGNIWHISAVALEKAIGAEFTHVPFGGAAPTITATLGGHVSAMIASVPEMAAQAQAGALNILAVFGDSPSSLFPDVPTAKSQGVDLQFGTWRGVGVPDGVPADRVAVLEKAFQAAAESQEFKDFMAKQGFNILYRGSAETAAYMEKDAPRFRALLEDMGLTVDK